MLGAKRSSSSASTFFLFGFANKFEVSNFGARVFIWGAGAFAPPNRFGVKAFELPNKLWPLPKVLEFMPPLATPPLPNRLLPLLASPPAGPVPNRLPPEGAAPAP